MSTARLLIAAAAMGIAVLAAALRSRKMSSAATAHTPSGRSERRPT